MNDLNRIEEWMRKNIREMKPYSSARSEFKGSADIFIDANENPFPSGYNRYPDPLQHKLKESIASARGWDIDKIMLGNGSDEIIDLLIRIFCEPGKDVIYSFQPSFGMYNVAASLNDVAIHYADLNEDFTLDIESFIENIPSRCKIVFLCSPNNPTGNSIPINQVLEIIASCGCIVVIDEAYIDFSDKPSMTSLVDSVDNLVVLQTFSKALGGAGLRIGMAYGNQKIIDALNKVKMPYNVSQLNQEAALSRIQSANDLSNEISIIKQERKRMTTFLSSFDFVKKVFPSDGNFLLVRFIDASYYYRLLLDRGIVTRDRSKLPGCQNCLRITIGLPDENTFLLDVLETHSWTLEKNKESI